MTGKINKNSGGFTLIEIIIAIAVIGVLSSIVVYGFFALEKNSDLNSSVQEFVSALKLAQNKTLASEGNAQYGVYIDTQVSPNQYILFKGSSYALRDTAADQVHYLQNTVEFHDINLSGGSQIVFDKLTGASDQPGSVSLRMRSDPGNSRTVYVASSGAIGYNPPEPDLLDASRLKDSRHVKFSYSRHIDAAQESITLTFNESQTLVIPIQSYLAAGQFRWEDTVNVGGSNQTVEIDTVRLNDPDTVFSIFRDRRYNNKSLKVTISGDGSGYLVRYSADGLTTDYSSVYVFNFACQ